MVKRVRATEVAFAVRPVVHQVLSASLQTGFEWGAFAKKHFTKRLARTWRRQMGRNICSESLYAGQFLKRPDPRINLESADDRSDRMAGCLVGLAAGDALGAPLEFVARQEVRKRFPQRLREMIASSLWDKGEYTDDTQMALLIAESLLANKDFVASDLAKRFPMSASRPGLWSAKESVVAPQYATPQKTVSRVLEHSLTFRSDPMSFPQTRNPRT